MGLGREVLMFRCNSIELLRVGCEAWWRFGFLLWKFGSPVHLCICFWEGGFIVWFGSLAGWYSGLESFFTWSFILSIPGVLVGLIPVLFLSYSSI